mgnify:CR=1 FL=1
MERIIILVSLVATVGSGAWWYVSSTSAEIETLAANNAVLESIATENRETVRRLRQDVVQEMRAVEELRAALEKSEEQRAGLIKIFRKHDLTRLATAKPGLIEKRINDGTEEAFADLESITARPE